MSKKAELEKKQAKLEAKALKQAGKKNRRKNNDAEAPAEDGAAKEE